MRKLTWSVLLPHEKGDLAPLSGWLKTRDDCQLFVREEYSPSSLDDYESEDDFGELLDPEVDIYDEDVLDEDELDNEPKTTRFFAVPESESIIDYFILDAESVIGIGDLQDFGLIEDFDIFDLINLLDQEVKWIALFNPRRDFIQDLIKSDFPLNRCFGIRFHRGNSGDAIFELIPVPSEKTDVPLAAGRTWLKSMKVPFLECAYHIESSCLEKIRVPMEIEAWKYFRNGIANLSTVDYLSQAVFQSTIGLIASILVNGTKNRMLACQNLQYDANYDPRYLPYADFLPVASDSETISIIRAEVSMLPEGKSRLKEKLKILIAGTPGIAKKWGKFLAKADNVDAVVFNTSIEETDGSRLKALKQLLENEKYHIIIECSREPHAHRVQLLRDLEKFRPSETELWIHTLSATLEDQRSQLSIEKPLVGYSGLIPTRLEKEHYLLEIIIPNGWNSNNSFTGEFIRRTSCDLVQLNDSHRSVIYGLATVLRESILDLLRMGVVKAPEDLSPAIQSLLATDLSVSELLETIDP